LLVVVQGAVASNTSRVTWHNDVQRAWKESQQYGRPLLVFVTRERCFHCDRMKERTFCDRAVAGAINASFVPLVLRGDGDSPLLRDLRVTAYPSTFVISPRAVILDRIDGYVAPEILASRLNSLRPTVPVSKLAKDP
jgi:thioredoxin-related protein